MIEYEDKLIRNCSLIVIGWEIQEAVQDGWEIDDNVPLVQVGWQYEVGFKRKLQQANADMEEINTRSLECRPEDVPKLTRAEILAKARAARGSKKEET